MQRQHRSETGAPGRCRVCGATVVAVREFGAGERPSGDSFPPGREYIHVPATPISREDSGDRELYDGRACREFADGNTEGDVYPPQPIEESRVDTTPE